MLLKIQKKEFDLLEDEALRNKWFAPLIPMIRAKSDGVKLKVYEQLNERQKAVFMFNAYYNHAVNSLAEFYWWSAYYMAQPRLWAELKLGLAHLNLTSMVQLLEKIEQTLTERAYSSNLGEFKATYQDLEQDPVLSRTFSSLYIKLNETSPVMLRTIGKAMRNNSTDFFLIEEE